MKILLSLTLAVAIASSSPLDAQTIVASSLRPTVGANDISSYASPLATPNGSQDYSNNLPPGETFTTLGNAAGYTLNSITVQGANSASNTAPTISFTLAIYSVGAAGALTELTQTAYAFPTADNNGPTSYFGSDYLTFNLPVALQLNPNSQYAYTISLNSVSYFGFAGSATDVYSGGQAIQTNNINPALSTIATAKTYGSGASQTTYDRNFDIGLTPDVAAPEPSTWAMMLGGWVALLGLGRLRRSGHQAWEIPGRNRIG